MSALWHPFADMARVSQGRVVMDRGDGVWLWDTRGRRYLDACAGLWYANVGHGREEIADAVAAQLKRLETHHVFNDYANRPALDLADRLAALAPEPESRVFFLSGGGDAIDSAAKLARLHWHEAGAPERRHIITRDASYHGTHGFGTSLAGMQAIHEGYGPLIGDISHVPHDSPEALEDEIARIGPDRVAAFVFEPVIASGGLFPPEPGYLRAIEAICRKHGVLTIADVVVSGFGRLGCWYGVERWALTPDIVAFAKGVTSGYLPLGGLLVAPRVAEPFWSRPGLRLFRHGPTYSGHAAACVAALTNLDILERERLLENARELEGELLLEMQGLLDHELVEAVRGGTGLLAGFDLRADLIERRPSLPMDALAVARSCGILTRPLDRGLAVAPPLIADRKVIRMIGEGLRESLDRLARLVEGPGSFEPDLSTLERLDTEITPVTACARRD
jgi:putrescine---pyruvate transaminase